MFVLNSKVLKSLTLNNSQKKKTTNVSPNCVNQLPNAI